MDGLLLCGGFVAFDEFAVLELRACSDQGYEVGSFAVASGVISGDMTGTLSGLGVSTDAVIDIDGRVCRPVTELRFVASASYAAVASGDLACSGDPALTGTLASAKQ